MGEKSDGEGAVLSEWAELSEEERTRHDVLFYCQEPIESLMPGEMARDLFLRSGLPLLILSKIWNLVDYPHDNMLDPGEFAIAMHLIQVYLLNRQLPRKLPENLRPKYREEVHVPTMTSREHRAYRRLFQTVDENNTGKLKASLVRELLLTSGLNQHQLAMVWNLSDINRDGSLNIDEFCIACHITRYCKTGAVINGPVNVQSLLPHKLPKTDLHAKLSRLKDLGKIKPKLMSLRERRKKEAAREAKRVVIQRERLKVLQLRHEVLKQSGLPWELEALLSNWLKTEEERVSNMEIIAGRLKKEHEKIRQETARTIIEEQKLTNDVKELQEEADTLRKKRQRNSLIKDIDPFHQLHEERKEEKQRGIQAIRKESEFEVVIPFESDPFDRESLFDPPLSGQDIFVNNEEAWQTNTKSDVSELTHGFEDNFVEIWTRAPKPDPPEEDVDEGGENRERGRPAEPPWSPTAIDKDFFFDDEEDPVFKTVPVTEEEDDLWSSLPQSVLTSQSEQLQYLQNKLAVMKEETQELNSQGAQLVFRNPEEYKVKEDQSTWDYPSIRRQVSDTHIKSKESPEVFGRRRSYAATTKTYNSPRSQYLEDHPPISRSKRHSLGTLPEAGKLESVLGLAALTGQSKVQSTDSEEGLLTTKTSEATNNDPGAIKFDENLNERTVEVEHLSDSSPGSPKNITFSDISNQSHDSDLTEDTRSPAERSLAKLFGKRKSLNREKAVVDSSDYHIAESASSLTPKSNVTVELKGETQFSDKKLENSEPTKEEDSRPETEVLRDTSKKQSAVEVEKPKEENNTSSKDRNVAEVKDKSVNTPSAQEQLSPLLRKTAHSGTQSDVQKRPQSLAGTSALLRPKGSSSALRPQSVAESPPRPPPRKHSKKRRQAPTPPGPTSPTSPSSPPTQSVRPLSREEKAARRISSPPLLQTFDKEARSPSGSSTSSSSATPVTSPSKPPRRPSRKKCPAPPPPVDIPPYSSVDNLGRYDQVRPPGSSIRRAGSLDNILHDDNSPVPPPRVKRRQRMRVSDIRGKNRSGSDNSGSDSPERWRRQIPPASHLANPPGATSSAYERRLQLELEMERRKQELEHMRLKYSGRLGDTEQSGLSLDLAGETSDFGIRRETSYQNVEYSSPFRNTPSSGETLKTVLRFDDGQDDTLHQYTNVDFSSSNIHSLEPYQHDRQNTSNNNAGESSSSKVVLNFNDDQDDTKSYEDVVLLSKKPIPEGGTSIPHTFIDGREEFDTWDQSYDRQNARVVLNLDTDHYSGPAIGNISPRSGMTAEEEYIIANRNPRKDVTTGGRGNGHFMGEGNGDSHDDSISNYNDSVSSADIFSVTKSENDGHGSDSDISDNGGSFNATFEPRVGDDGENDSGITLVSYHDKKSPEHNRRGVSKDPDNKTYAISPRVVELQQRGSPSPSNSPSPPPLPHSTPPEGLPGRDRDSDSAGEGRYSPQIQRAQQQGISEGLSTNQRYIHQTSALADRSGALIFDSSWEPRESSDHIQQRQTQAHSYTTDPITGLKRTGVVSPTDKDLALSQTKEPVIRLKKKEDGVNPAVEQVRMNILEEMKVRTKKAETWLSDDDLSTLEKTDSERAYEERKVYLKDQGDKVNVMQPQDNFLMYQAIQPKKPGDVDSRSIADQDKIVQHWEGKIATGDVSLFPRQPEPVKKSSTLTDLSDFVSEVETESIANLATTKSIWERKASENSDEVPFKPSGLTSSKSWDAGRGGGYRDTNIKAHDLQKTNTIPEYESAIESEIRLAQEREEELKQRLQKQQFSEDKEKGSWEAEDHRKMPIGKVPPPVRVVEVVPKNPSTVTAPVGHPDPRSPQGQVILPEFEHGDPESSTDASAGLPSSTPKNRMETAIEREIREQQEREAILRQDALNRQNFNKEQEQSEYERQEKEQERINAHESIVEREIRLQREKELELSRQRRVPSSADHTPTPSELSVSSSEPVSPPLIEPSDSVSFSKSPQVNTSLHGMSDSRDTLSPDSGVASVDTKLVTYEEAISSYGHRGESIIARELREQKEKEEELRKRWNDMGVQSPLASQETSLPYDWVESQSQPPKRPQPKGMANGSSHGAFTNGSAKGAGGLYPQSNGARRGSVDSDRSQASSGDSAVKSRDDEQEVKTNSYASRGETPIEKEIRLAREREEELRAQKGLSPRTSQPSRGDVMVEVNVDLPRRAQSQEHGKMKHYSSGRLQHEIQQEKQRELSMQKAGNILTTSEERAETKKYMDVIDKDNLNAPAPRPQKPPASQTITRTGAYMRSPSMPIYNSQNYSMGSRKISAPGSIAQSAAPPVENGTEDIRLEPEPEPEPAQPKPIVRSVSHQAKLTNNSANTAELRIEAELREMREREEELRRQRDIAMGKAPAPRQIPEEKEEQETAPVEVYSKSNTVFPGDVGEKKARKKSALAQQWEQKFGNA